MNCCNHEQDKNNLNENNEHNNGHKHNKHKGHKHGPLMMILCLIPMGVIFLWPLFNKAESSKLSPLTFLVFLLCPLMHVLMMLGMRKNHNENK